MCFPGFTEGVGLTVVFHFVNISGHFVYGLGGGGGGGGSSEVCVIYLFFFFVVLIFFLFKLFFTK